MNQKITSIIGALNYMVVYLAIKYVDQNSDKKDLSFVDKINLFNKGNNFCLEKVNLIPFFICNTQMKESERMINFFTDKELGFYFVPEEKSGIVNLGINDLLVYKNENLFFNTNHQANLEIRSLLNIDSLLVLKDRILEDFFIDKNLGKYMLDSIETNINILESKFLKGFSNLSLDTLFFWYRSHFSFRVYFGLNTELFKENYLDNFYEIIFIEKMSYQKDSGL